MTYTRSDLEKMLRQDFGCTWEASRIAVGRYLGEAYGGYQPWWTVYEGDIKHQIIITEWIWGTTSYWRKPRWRP